MTDEYSSEIITSEREIMKAQNIDPNSLDPKQLEIYKGLKSIGHEISAFYLDGIKILCCNNLETKSYLLAHIAREIEAGLRDILSHEKEEKVEKEKSDNRPSGHIASIANALGVDKDNPFVEKWYEVAGAFHKYAHRQGAMKAPRKKSEFENLWKEFENVLFYLVGTYYNLLDRIDRILQYETPTEEIIETLPNLLELDARYSYFFRNLKSPKWLKSLKEKDYFAPERNPKPQEVPDQPGSYRIPPWNALDYLETVADKNSEQPSDEITNLLIEIVNSIANYRNEEGERIENYWTDWIIVKIICKLPLEKITKEHIEFIGTALRSKWGNSLLAAEIGRTVLPKLINNETKELLLKLMDDVILEYKKNGRATTDKYTFMMNEYRPNEVLKRYKPAIARLCGIEAAEIGLNKMLTITNEDKSQFNYIWIPTIEDHPQAGFPDRYECQLVRFVRDMFELSEPNRVEVKINDLRKEQHPIFKRIAIHTINYHYKDLNELFWGWEGNPLDEGPAKHELYELLKVNCSSFSKKQIEKLLGWIESKKYYITDEIKSDKERIEKILAYRKKEWLSALLDTKDPDIIASFEKYQRIDPTELDHPGLDYWSRSWIGTISPIEKVELLNKLNQEIAEYLVNYKGGMRWGEPSQEGLSECLKSCVSENPEKFANDMGPFLNVQRVYQHALLWGLSEAWRGKKNFPWDGPLSFMSKIIKSDNFWNEEYKEESYNYRNSIISQIANLIEDGTRDDNHAFDAELLPEAEKILLILAEKAQSDLSEMHDLLTSVLNSSKGKIFSAMINYSFRCARLSKKQQGERWVRSIKEDFDRRLHREVEPSPEFSVILGEYLANLSYLDEKWVANNINRIFPKNNDTHWEATFTGYLFSSRVYKNLYLLLRENDHYTKALQTDFGDSFITERLAQEICIGYLEDWDKLDDKTSLICRLIRNGNVNQLSAIVSFFWRQRDKLTDKIKAKVKPLWRELFDFLSQNQEKLEYQKIISNLSEWLSLIDDIDEQTLERLKLSAKYIRAGINKSSFIEYLLKHATKTPAKVGEIYLEILHAELYPDYKKENIQGIVRILYNQGQKEIADRICNMYGEKGFDFLRTIYEEHRNPIG